VGNPAVALGEYGWSGAASTHFWLSPKQDMIVVTLQQLMPFKAIIKNKVKPLIYEAVTE
jgi:CubicO group peptidase (beta-lactamase class C family)